MSPGQPPAPARAPAVAVSPADSLRAVRAFRRALVRTGGLAAGRGYRVTAFAPGRGGFTVALAPDPATVGGGGRAWVSRSGRVRHLAPFR